MNSVSSGVEKNNCMPSGEEDIYLDFLQDFDTLECQDIKESPLEEHLSDLSEKTIGIVADYIFSDCRAEDPTSYDQMAMRKFLWKVTKEINHDSMTVHLSFEINTVSILETINSLFFLSRANPICAKTCLSRISFIVNFQLIYKFYEKDGIAFVKKPILAVLKGQREEEIRKKPLEQTFSLCQDSEFLENFKEITTQDFKEVAAQEGLEMNPTFKARYQFDMLYDFDSESESDLGGRKPRRPPSPPRDPRLDYHRPREFW